MAKKGKKTEDQFAKIEETLSRTEQYIENNQKNLIRIVAAIVASLHFVGKRVTASSALRCQGEGIGGGSPRACITMRIENT